MVAIVSNFGSGALAATNSTFAFATGTPYVSVSGTWDSATVQVQVKNSAGNWQLVASYTADFTYSNTNPREREYRVEVTANGGGSTSLTATAF